jgi:rod shape-determining protein MreC
LPPLPPHARDRTVRRRRAVLAACVVASLVLLTAYFGESGSGGLHGAQRAMVDVMSPIQEGANRALKPVRDLFGWFGDTVNAKEERDKLRAERDELRRRVGELEVARQEVEQLRGLVELEDAGVGAYQPLTARVTSRNPSIWFSTLVINKGSSDGVQVDQPVVGGGALIGKVSSVTGGSATVKLVTDEGFAVAAKTAPGGEPGTVEPAVGSQGTLVLDLVPQASDVEEGNRVYTAGTTDDSRLPSLFPRGILIGRITSIDDGEGPLTRTIKVKPAADLRRIDIVAVLTKPDAGADAGGDQARVP